MTFDKKGPQNTGQCLTLALKAAKEHGIHNIVVASSAGDTALQLKEYAGDYNIVCVALAYGTRAPGETNMSDAVRSELEQAGIRVVFATHVLSGAERGLSRKHKGIYPVEIMADTLRMFGRGVKVGVECAIMAVDAGLVPYGEDVISIGGTAKGADSAIILRPEHANNILETQIREIICMPWEV